ncbi:tyrosinase family protein [Dokdonia ponticola]|uniref:Tyrosinase family protein n=1 Tax=Dokdonia ponticola TaxID=2041041 RepID=A0ABV9I266_9FLAO
MSYLRIRKSVYALTDQEILAIRSAFDIIFENALADYLLFSDILENNGHATATDLNFLTWNRAFFLSFEDFLRSKNPDLFLPYWDYTSEEAIKNGMPALFSDPTYVVKEGGKEKANPLYRSTKQRFCTSRTNDNSDTTLLVEARRRRILALDAKNYTSFNKRIWVMDATAHVWIGGTMTDVPIATLDPLFWFIHCNLDRYWWKFQQNKEMNTTIPDTVLQEELTPFRNDEGKPLYGKDVLNTKILGYTYLR